MVLSLVRSGWKSLISRLAPRATSRIQEEADTFRVYILTNYRRRLKENPNLSIEDKRKIIHPGVVDQLTMKQSILEDLDGQVLKLFTDAESKMPDMPPSEGFSRIYDFGDGGVRKNGTVGRNESRVNVDRSTSEGKRGGLKKDDSLRKNALCEDFFVEIKPSGVNHVNAGLGAFAKTDLGVGKVLGFYPGVVVSCRFVALLCEVEFCAD